MRVLIVDDSRAVRTLFKSLLTEMKFEVVEAVDGVDALERLRTAGPFEVALVDWEMPRMNGLDLVKEIRGKPEWKATKLMMVTTHTNFDSVAEAMAAGADEYLMKPLTSEMLVEKLRLLGLVF